MNEEDIKTVLILLKRKPKESSYTIDDEDNIGFMYLIIDNCRLEWQVRGHSCCFLSLTIKNERYDLSYPKDELHDALVKTTKKEKERIKFGLPLREKLNININQNKKEFTATSSNDKQTNLKRRYNISLSYFLFVGYSIILLLIGIMLGKII